MIEKNKFEKNVIIKQIISSIGENLNTKWDNALASESIAKGSLQAINDLYSMVQSTFNQIKNLEENKDKDLELINEFYNKLNKNMEIIKNNAIFYYHKCSGRKEAFKESVDYVKERYQLVDFFTKSPEERLEDNLEKLENKTTKNVDLKEKKNNG